MTEFDLSAFSDSLRAHLDQAKAHAEELTVAAKNATDNVRRIERALRELEGTPKAAPAKPKGRTDSYARPKDVTMDKVLGALRQAERATKSDLVNGTGLSTDTVRRALHHLRKEERVRKAASVGGATVYAPMENN